MTSEVLYSLTGEYTTLFWWFGLRIPKICFCFCHFFKKKWTENNNKNSPYIFRFKNMADHFILPLPILGGVRCFHIILGVRSWHSPAGHQYNYIPNICNVGNGPQRMIHHSFLGKKNHCSRLFSTNIPQTFSICTHLDSINDKMNFYHFLGKQQVISTSPWYFGLSI